MGLFYEAITTCRHFQIFISTIFIIMLTFSLTVCEFIYTINRLNGIFNFKQVWSWFFYGKSSDF